MNEKIKELAEQAEVYYSDSIYAEEDLAALQKFAELIIQECVKQCQQEWYDLNNANDGVSDDARATAIRVGQKNGMLKAISKIKEHLGVKE